jgi:hypothetical protein
MRRALTLLQPWAECMFHHFPENDSLPAKMNETRSWRGSDGFLGMDILIHSSLAARLDALMNWPAWRKQDFVDDCVLTHGAILGVARLVSYLPSEDARNCLVTLRLSGNERARRELSMGDYRNGRWIWSFTNAVRFQTPIPCKGRQQVWILNDPVALPAVEEQLLKINRFDPRGEFNGV